MKSGRFHFPSSNNGSELQDPAALDNGSADAGNRFRPSEFPCGSTGTGEIAETGNAVQCSGLLGKGEHRAQAHHSLSQLFISNLPMSAHAYNAEQRRQDRKAEVEAIDIISVRLWW